MIRKISYLLILIFSLIFVQTAHAQETTFVDGTLSVKEHCDSAAESSPFLSVNNDNECVRLSENPATASPVAFISKVRYFYKDNLICNEFYLSDGSLNGPRGPFTLQSSKCTERIYPAKQEKQPEKKAVTPQEQPAKETVKQPERLEIKTLYVGKDIKQGDIINGDKNKITKIILRDGSHVDLEPDPKASFKYETEEDIAAESGLLHFVFNKPFKRKVHYGNAVVAVRGTEFIMDADQGKLIVKLLEGELVFEIDGRKGEIKMTGGNQLTIAKSGKVTGPEPFDTKAIDKWWEGKEPQNNTLLGLMVILPFLFFVALTVVSIIRRMKNPKSGKVNLFLGFGNSIFSILAIVALFTLLFTTDPNNFPAKYVPAIRSFGSIIYYILVAGIFILSIVRILKKYNPGRSLIWLFMALLLAILMPLMVVTPKS